MKKAIIIREITKHRKALEEAERKMFNANGRHEFDVAFNEATHHIQCISDLDNQLAPDMYGFDVN